MLSKKELIGFEQRINDLYEQGKIMAPVHLSRGNEDQIRSIFEDVKKGDWVFSNWRSHYHALLKGIPCDWLENEIIEGRSMHICNKEHNFLSSSIVGGNLPIALGTAMALKMKNSDNKVWVFSGDMSAEIGAFHEATKYAFGHNLPINFVVEDDGWGVYTPTKKVWGESVFTGRTEKLVRYNQIKEECNLSEKGGSSIRRYSYQRVFPHHGIGLWINFPDEEKSKLEGLVKRGLDYESKTKQAMEYLAKDKNTVFMGQTVEYKGSPIYNSLENIASNKRIELPVMEDSQMGMAIGMSLEGYLPISIFPRFDFLTLATNQLVNHLDKMYELSEGQFNPKVIVRTMVGSRAPLYPGPQHCQDHTEAYRLMLTNMEVVKLAHSSQIIPEYKKALKRDKSTLLVEV